MTAHFSNMSRHMWSLAWTAGWLVCIAAGCRPEDASLGGDAETTAARGPVPVTVQPIVFRTIQRRINVVGTLHGFEEVTISAKVGGRVRRIVHDVADRVGAGEVLLLIDPTDFELNLRQAQKALLVDLARIGLDSPPDPSFDVLRVPLVIQARLRMEQAKTRLDRALALSERNAVAVEDLEDRRTEFGVAEAAYASQIDLARADLATIQLRQEAIAQAQQQLQDATVRAPVPMSLPEGTAEYAITSRSSAEGALVRPGDELFRLVVEHPLKLRLKVPERFAADVALEQKVEVRVEAYERIFAGTVRRINPAVDPVTRTFEVEVHVPSPERLLKPGGFAKADILTRVEEHCPTVPVEAVLFVAGHHKVFLVDGQEAREVRVDIGEQTPDWMEVRGAAFSEGALVVTSGQTALADGTHVTVRSANTADDSPPHEDASADPEPHKNAAPAAANQEPSP